MPAEVDGGWSLYASDMEVGQHPVAEKGAAVELLVEFVPYDAVSSIGANEPRGLSCLFTAISVFHHIGDSIASLLEICQLSSPLSFQIQGSEMRFQQTLGLALRNHEDEFVLGVDLRSITVPRQSKAFVCSSQMPHD
jgi:hypothetical protein